MRRAVPMLWMVFVLGFLAGCAKEPTADIQAARQAMDNARAAEAADYAQDSWAAAQDVQMKLDAEIEAQKNASALSRSYDRVKALAADTRSAADRAGEEAATGKTRVRDEARKAIDDAKTLRDEVAKMVEHAPQGKGTVADVAALRADTAGTETTVKDAEDAFAAGHYKEAKAKADAAVQALDTVKAQVQTAQQSRSARHRA